MNLTTHRAPFAVSFQEVCAHNVRASSGETVHSVVRHESAVRMKDRGEEDTTLVLLIASCEPNQTLEVTVEIGHGVWELSLLSLLEKILLLDRIPVMLE